MVIDDLDIFRSRLRPPEADPVLHVDADRMLSRSVVFQGVQTTAGWKRQVVQPDSDVEVIQHILRLAPNPPVDLSGGLGVLPVKEVFGGLVAEESPQEVYGVRLYVINKR